MVLVMLVAVFVLEQLVHVVHVRDAR